MEINHKNWSTIFCDPVLELFNMFTKKLVDCNTHS